MKHTLHKKNIKQILEDLLKQLRYVNIFTLGLGVLSLDMEPFGLRDTNPANVLVHSKLASVTSLSQTSPKSSS